MTARHNDNHNANRAQHDLPQHNAETHNGMALRASVAGPGAGVDDLLMETGDHLLLETGDAILLDA